jgi:hypothetical protein
MMPENRLLPGWCLCAALAGCAGVPAGPEATTIAPEPGRALVVGWGNTAGESAKAAFTPVQGTRVSSLYVSKANEQKISFGENIARLAPGEYDLTISCGLYINLQFFPGDTVIHADLGGNQVYRLRAEPVGRRCYPSLEDITGKDK